MSPTISNQEKIEAADKIIAIIEEFRKFDLEMQAQAMLTFLEIMRKEGRTVSDIGEALGLATSSASRNVAALSKYHRMRKPGHDLIRAEENIMNRRQKLISLTPKGKIVAKSLIEILQR